MHWWWSSQTISISTFSFVLFNIWILFFSRSLPVCKTDNHLLSTWEAFSIYQVHCKRVILHVLPLTSNSPFIHLFINQNMMSHLWIFFLSDTFFNRNCNVQNPIKLHGLLSSYFTEMLKVLWFSLWIKEHGKMHEYNSWEVKAKISVAFSELLKPVCIMK